MSETGTANPGGLTLQSCAAHARLLLGVSVPRGRVFDGYEENFAGRAGRDGLPTREALEEEVDRQEAAGEEVVFGDERLAMVSLLTFLTEVEDEEEGAREDA